MPFEAKLWNHVEEYLPHDFDLVLVKTNKKEIKKGWYTGQIWQGGKLQDNEIVKYWKLKQDLT